MSARPLLDELPGACPERIGKYRIEGVLGEGAMGIVYKATDPQIRRPVAIKTIRRPLLAPGAQDLDALARFRNEAEAAGRLTHANIVSVYEFGGGDADAAAGELYLAMEYVHGTPLSQLLARGTRLPLPDVMSLMLQLLDALRAAHDQGVWHRDIKPANLLITPDGRLKVTDFGIARIDSSALTQATTALGSPGYMAPERYTGDAPDARVDIFSCGVLLYELLTGSAPFKGAVDMVMYQVLQTEPPAPSSLPIPCRPPARYDAIVARALAKRAVDRYASVQEMMDALVEATPAPIRPALTTQTVALALQPLKVPQSPMAPASTPLAASSSTGPTQKIATAPQPSATVPPRAHWDPATLRHVEQVLTRHLGPVAPLVVRQAARQCTDLASLVRHVAYGTLGSAERKAFVDDLRRAGPIAPSRPRADVPVGPATSPAAAPATGSVPVLGDTPLAPQTIDRATRVLAEHIGPIATLLVQRAAASAPSREAFFVVLADQAGEQADRKALLAQLWRAA
jgi:serine/threonine-protein kinase